MKKCSFLFLTVLLAVFMLALLLLTSCQKEERLTGEHAVMIEYAQSLAGGVQTRYTDAHRTGHEVKNQNMILLNKLSSESVQSVSALTDPEGNPYIENTMEVFAKTTDGKTYYAGSTFKDKTRVNIYRMGYYYYDVHILEHDFYDPASPYDDLPLYLDRTFHTFSDKLHQELHIVAGQDTENIAEIGMITAIPADRVAKIVVKDAAGEHDTIETVDWDSAEYIGFDISDVGIFGYILPYDNSSSMTVALEDGQYIITQVSTPKNGMIYAATVDTSDDFFMGQRLYTDGTHDFTAFLHEAYCERNPLTGENFLVDANRQEAEASFTGYDPLRGVYTFTLKGTDFYQGYYDHPNMHFNASFGIRNDGYDRDIYIMTNASPGGSIECAAVLDSNDMMLPVKLEVCKNFQDGEEHLYKKGDTPFSEVYMPLRLAANQRDYLSVLNLYQDWGQYPLKQLSSIAFHVPYYHLSTGVTESNCLIPSYRTGWVPSNFSAFPDHRPMSMPASSDLKNMYEYGAQPQRPLVGRHLMLEYTTADGTFVTAENQENIISSAGPTYADITRTDLTEDGKIKATYRHIEMPQTDENRTYYEITYEVLDTIEISNFATDFSFCSTMSLNNHRKVSFIDEFEMHNVVNKRDENSPAYTYVLTKDHPYFAFFYSEDEVYGNNAVMVYDSECIVEGQACDANFTLTDEGKMLSLSLNLGEVTLQKGDKFTLKIIFMPWGGGWITDEDEVFKYMDDDLVLKARENSILNPFHATAVENCEVVDSVFLPRVKSTDGKSAVFTLNGGCDYLPDEPEPINMTVRVDNLTDLGRVKLEEKVGDSWVKVELSSKDTPDSSGNTHDYDGYLVHYEGGLSYDYSFVVTITDGQPRTFRVTVDTMEEPTVSDTIETVAPETEPTPAPEDARLQADYAPSLYLEAVDLYEIAVKGKKNGYYDYYGYDQVDFKEENDLRYITLTSLNAAGTQAEAYFSPIRKPTKVSGVIAIKYRSTVENIWGELFASSEGSYARGHSYTNFGMQNDGSWQLLIVPLDERFPAYDGEKINYLRFDYLNSATPLPTNASTDIAYVAVFDSEADALAFEQEAAQ